MEKSRYRKIKVSKNEGGNSRSKNKNKKSMTKDLVATRQIQPQTQAIKLLLQEMQWPQLQSTFKEASWKRPRIMGPAETEAAKARDEYHWLLEQYKKFKYAAKETFNSDEPSGALDFYFSMYRNLLEVTDIQNADGVLKELQHLLFTQEHKYAILTYALDESEEQLAAKREELKLLLKDQEGDGTAQVG